MNEMEGKLGYELPSTYGGGGGGGYGGDGNTPNNDDGDTVPPRALGGEFENSIVPGNEVQYQEKINLLGTGPVVGFSPIDYKFLPFFFFIALIPLLLMGIVFGLCPPLFGIINNLCMMSVFTVCTCLGNPPMWSYYIWVVGGIATLLVMKRNKGRLGLFMTYKSLAGPGEIHSWAMTGVWSWSYDNVAAICREYQTRRSFFGNNQASCPNVFPPGISEPVNGSNAGGFPLWIYGPKHTMYRRAFHTTFVGQYHLIKQRFETLPDLLLPVFSRTAKGTVPADAAEYLAMANANMPGQKWNLYTELVSRSVWWVLFGVKLQDDEIEHTVEWGGMAAYFILPQFFQNLACGLLAKKVTAVRRKSVEIMCKRPSLVALFQQISQQQASCGTDYSNPEVTQTMDEISFAVNFAGLLGTSQLLQSTLFALNKKPGPQVPPDSEVFPDKLNGMDYTDAYNAAPVRFLVEVARVDPPVTSANCTLQEPVSFVQKPCCFGGRVNAPVGTGNQYMVSLAMRDEKVFPDPTRFDPFRGTWQKGLSWNGTFPFPQEVAASNGRITTDTYDPMAAPTYDPNGPLNGNLPLTVSQANNNNRVCPGRNIALQICTTILGMCPALNNTNLLVKPNNGGGQ